MDSIDNENFYRYTSGRWLWAEETRLQERYKKFTVLGLKSLAAQACGAQSCVSMVKLAEGGFNKVFRLSMDNGAVVIARIPTPIVGPASRVLASEVATMDFVSIGVNLQESEQARLTCTAKVRNVLDIPVPKVIAWDGETANAAGCEFILMEEAKGKPLGAIWPGMELDEKFKIVEEVVAVQKKLQSVTFSRSGCWCSEFLILTDIPAPDTEACTTSRTTSRTLLDSALAWIFMATYRHLPRSMQKIDS